MRPLVVPLIDDRSVAEFETEPPVSSSADTVPAFALRVGATETQAELGQTRPGPARLRVHDEEFAEAPTLPGVQIRLSSV